MQLAIPDVEGAVPMALTGCCTDAGLLEVVDALLQACDKRFVVPDSTCGKSPLMCVCVPVNSEARADADRARMAPL